MKKRLLYSYTYSGYRKIFFLLALSFLPFFSSAQLSLSSTITDATCPADSNGSISVTASGGSLPYTYQWLPGGEASATVTGLTPGSYQLTVTDNMGVDTTTVFTVGPAAFSNDTTGNITPPNCTDNGIIILDVTGGTPAYQYNWSTGSQNQGVSQIGEGTYTVQVTDALNCTVVFEFVLSASECFVEPAQHFTPNGDGINDTWTIEKSQYFPDAHLIVFDRWGLKVYERKGTYEPWNGKSYLGVPVPDACYYYFFFRDKDEKQKNAAQGSVTIIR